MTRGGLCKRGGRVTVVAAALALSSVGLTFGMVGEAHAFCRTTTCDPNAGDECARNKDGCIRDGVILRWIDLPIVYRFHSAGSGKLDNDTARDVIRRAFDAWENVKCSNGKRTSLRFKEGSDFDADKPLEDDAQGSVNFGIYFRDDEWPHNNADESLALTNQTYGKITGKIDYADIEINTAQEKFALGDADQGIDLQAVVTHEVGHYIGLAHSNDVNSIMVARYCQSQDRCGATPEQKRELSEDDINAVCGAYPPPDTGDSAPPGATCSQQSGVGVGVASSGRGSVGGNLLSVFGLSFLAAAIARQRRSRRQRNARM